MNNQIKYFDKEVWVAETVFHYYGNDIPLDKIEHITINFRVVSTISSVLFFLVSLVGMIWFYFKFEYLSYIWLIPLVACFAASRYMFDHYVELIVQYEGKKIKTVVTSMWKRHWAYELEEYICTRTGLEMPHGSKKK